MSIIILRLHNHIASGLKLNYPEFKGQQIAKTAKTILQGWFIKRLLPIYLKTLVGYTYINPIGEPHVQMFNYNQPLVADRELGRGDTPSDYEIVNKLLYIFHGLIPPNIKIKDSCGNYNDRPLMDYIFTEKNNLSDKPYYNILEEDTDSLNSFFKGLFKSRIGKQCIQNMPPELLFVEIDTLNLALKFRIKYVEMCRLLGVKIPKSFEDMCPDKEIQGSLKKVFGYYEYVDIYTGLLLSNYNSNRNLSDEQGLLFIQAVSPIIQSEINGYGVDEFTEWGYDFIKTFEVGDFFQIAGIEDFSFSMVD